MHRDITRHLVLLSLTYLLVSAARPAPLPTSTTSAPPPPLVPHYRDDDDRRTCRHSTRSPFLAPAPQPQTGRSDPDCARPPGGGVTRRGRRGASARRRGCRGGRAWRRSGPGGRRRCVMAGLINIQSLLPKIASLQHEHLNRLDYDFCIITETCLRSATASRLVNFPGYALHRADRPGDVGHGGVGILVRDSYAATVIPQPSPECADCRLESLWLRIKPQSGKHFSVAEVYRPPRRTVAAVQADLSELEVQFQRVLLRHPGPIFIMGDLNCDLTDTSSSPGKSRLLEMLRSFSLEQFVTQPTYSSGSLLDVVICNSSDVVQRVGAFKCAFSPHCFIRVLLRLPKYRRKSRCVRTRLFKNINHLSLFYDLHLVDWSGVFSCSSVHDKWSYLAHCLITVFDRHAPLRTTSVRNPRAPAVTSATLCLMAERRGVLRREGRSPAFREIDRRVRSAIRRDCRTDIEAKLRARGSSSLYRTVRPLVAGKRSDTHPPLCHTG